MGVVQTSFQIAEAQVRGWMDALYARHSSDLNFRELRRAIQALSDRYVHKRESLKSGAPLDSAGKRAAFCWFYTCLHFRIAEAALRVAGHSDLLPGVTDLGGGTGAAALAARACGHGATSGVSVIDRDPGVLREAAWNAKALGVTLKAKREDLSALRGLDAPRLILAAYAINELDAGARDRLLTILRKLLERGCRVVVIEPISKSITPWWTSWEQQLAAFTPRSHSLSLAPELPDIWWEYSRACRLNHQRVKARCLIAG